MEALASIERQTRLPYELIVVVDHNDELYERLPPVLERITAFPARAVANVYERGLSGARNTGVEEASGEVMAFMDDDAVASEDWLDVLIAGYEDERVWGVGGHVSPRWLAPKPAWMAEEFYWVIGCSYKGMPEQTASVRNFHGCNASFRSELFERVGNFSPDLGRRGALLAGAEETELCLRATSMHPERLLLFSPEARVFHAVTPERTRWTYLISRCFSEGRSKAWMVRSTGWSIGLSAELEFLRGIPRLAARLAFEGLRGRDLTAFSRAAAVLVGSAATVSGFALDTLRLSRRNDDDALTVSVHAGEHDVAADVSVVVCTFSPDRWTLLCRAIESLMAQALTPREIIVTVDHCAELVPRIRDAFPSVRVIENLGPPGLSEARNAAIAASRGDIVAFLDDDAVADREWLERMCVAFANADVAGVGGHTSPEWSVLRPGWWPDEFDWVVGASYRGMPQRRSFVRNVHGGNAAFRRAIFDRVGGFLPDVGRVLSLPYGGEETEICIRTRRLIPEARFVYEPEAHIGHHVPPGRVSLRYFLSRCFREGMSKARIVHYEGFRAGLRTESTYLGHVLPRAALRAASAVKRRDADLIAQAGVSLLGISAAASGFFLELTKGFRAGGVR